MVEWFHERYIARQEHEEIVAFYRKLVAQLHVTARDLRTQIDARTDIETDVEPDIRIDDTTPAVEPQQETPARPQIDGPNIITIDFQRHHRPAGSRRR